MLQKYMANSVLAVMDVLHAFLENNAFYLHDILLWKHAKEMLQF